MFASPQKVEVLANAFLRAVARGRDNELFVILADLLQNLVRFGVNPYYVFQCRPVRRVKHGFQIPISEAYRIVEQAKAQLDGHSKRFKFIMSHRTGKIEIVGMDEDRMYFKYHQAKHPRNRGRFFSRPMDRRAGWLDDLHPTKS